jgi:hypothetical protein
MDTNYVATWTGNGDHYCTSPMSTPEAARQQADILLSVYEIPCDSPIIIRPATTEEVV